MNSIIALLEGPFGVHGDPSGPMDYMCVYLLHIAKYLQM